MHFNEQTKRFPHVRVMCLTHGGPKCTELAFISCAGILIAAVDLRWLTVRRFCCLRTRSSLQHQQVRNIIAYTTYTMQLSALLCVWLN